MSLLGLPRTMGNIRRATQIAIVLTRHGFGHVLSRLRLADYIPGLSRLRLKMDKGSLTKHSTPMPERMTQVLEDLGPTFVKFGQLLATRPDLIPPEYLKAFSRLQDDVEPFPTEDAIRTIENSLGDKLDHIFSSFDRTPIASGSIGQVHTGVLRTGEAVVIKVKRPNTDSRIRDDIDLLLWLAGQVENTMPELEVLRPKALVEEFSRTMRREIDFVAEASYTSKFREEFINFPHLTTPQVYWDYVTHDVLVLERIMGTRLSADPSLEKYSLADRRALANELGRVFMHQFFINGLFHADPHPGNIFIQDGPCLGLIDFGQAGHLADDLRQQLAMTLVAVEHGDFDTIADIYADIGGISDTTNIREFRNDLIHLIDRYYGIPIDKMDFSHLFEELVTVAREHGIFLPRDLVLLGKSLVTIVGVAQKIDPDFRLDKVAQPFTKKIMKDRLSPRKLTKGGVFGMYRLMTMLRRAPIDIRDILQKARNGKFKIIFHHEALDGLTERLDRSFSRLSLSLVLGAIIIGSATVLSSPAMGSKTLPMLGEIPISYIFAGGGFAFAVIIGFALIWNIIRSDRM